MQRGHIAGQLAGASGTNGISTFKIDGLDIPDKRADSNLRALLDAVRRLMGDGRCCERTVSLAGELAFEMPHLGSFRISVMRSSRRAFNARGSWRAGLRPNSLASRSGITIASTTPAPTTPAVNASVSLRRRPINPRG